MTRRQAFRAAIKPIPTRTEAALRRLQDVPLINRFLDDGATATPLGARTILRVGERAATFDTSLVDEVMKQRRELL